MDTERIIFMKKRILTVALVGGIALALCACDEEYEEYDEAYEYYSDEYSDDGTYEQSDEHSDDDNYSAYDQSEEYSYDDSDSSYYQFDGYQSYSSYGSGDYPFDTSLGSAKELDGNIAVISIFVNDATTSWNFENSKDAETEGVVFNNIKIACEYIENVSKDYGRNVHFIYDWEEYPELAYNLDLDADYRRIDDYNYDMDSVMWETIDSNIPTGDILNKVNATQAIYLMNFNTPASNNITSCTRRHYDGMPYPYEMCMMFIRSEGELEVPADFAHEMLHTFGAVDLYTASDVSQEYVDYAEQTRLNDIMRTSEDPRTGEYHSDSIKNEVTDITAYYVGLTDYSETVEEWGLPRSEH